MLQKKSIKIYKKCKKQIKIGKNNIVCYNINEELWKTNISNYVVNVRLQGVLRRNKTNLFQVFQLMRIEKYLLKR